MKKWYDDRLRLLNFLDYLVHEFQYDWNLIRDRIEKPYKFQDEYEAYLDWLAEM